MVEYGNAAGQVSGHAGGGVGGGGPTDVGAAAVNALADTFDKIAALPPEMLLIGTILILAGLFVLKRAF